MTSKFKIYQDPRGETRESGTSLDSETIRAAAIQQANEMIRESWLQGFWEAYVGPFDIEYDFCPTGISVKMTPPVVYLSPLAGSPC
jgi:hypothetical protein